MSPCYISTQLISVAIMLMISCRKVRKMSLRTLGLGINEQVSVVGHYFEKYKQFLCTFAASIFAQQGWYKIHSGHRDGSLRTEYRKKCRTTETNRAIPWTRRYIWKFWSIRTHRTGKARISCWINGRNCSRTGMRVFQLLKTARKHGKLLTQTLTVDSWIGPNLTDWFFFFKFSAILQSRK